KRWDQAHGRGARSVDRGAERHYCGGEIGGMTGSPVRISSSARPVLVVSHMALARCAITARRWAGRNRFISDARSFSFPGEVPALAKWAEVCLNGRRNISSGV